jgi:hypothetical protein
LNSLSQMEDPLPVTQALGIQPYIHEPFSVAVACLEQPSSERASGMRSTFYHGCITVWPYLSLVCYVESS